MSGLARRAFLLRTAAAVASAPVWLTSSIALAQDARTLRLASSRAANTLDPQKYQGQWVIMSLVYEPLVAYSATGEIVPALAEAWEVSGDGLTYTFHLRPGVTFSDGTPFDADAALWNLDRWIGQEDHSWLQVSANFDHHEKVDDHTIRLVMREKAPQALIELTTIAPMRFLSPASVAENGDYVSPVGTGRWIVEVSDSDHTVLTRNDNYWGEKPGYERITIPVIPDGRARVAALRAGELDMIGGTFCAQLSPQEAMTLSGVPGITVETAIGTDTIILGFNPTREVTMDERVRQAASLCLDRAAIAQVVMNGFADPTVNLFPPSVPYSGERRPVPERDVEAARALLEEAGWVGDGVREKDGVPLALELVISEDAVPGSRSLGQVIQSELGEAGFGITLREVDHVTRHDDIPMMRYDLTIFVTNGAPYDPHGTMTTYFLSTFVSGTDGKMFVDAESLDPLILAALSADEADRGAAYGAALDWLDEHHAVVPVYHPQRLWAHTDRVVRFVFPPTEYDMPDRGIELG